MNCRFTAEIKESLSSWSPSAYDHCHPWRSGRWCASSNVAVRKRTTITKPKAVLRHCFLRASNADRARGTLAV